MVGSPRGREQTMFSLGRRLRAKVRRARGKRARKLRSTCPRNLTVSTHGPKASITDC